MSDSITTTNAATAITTVSGEIARTDTKAGLLLTLNGLLVAALSLQDSPADSGTLALILTIISAAAVATSVGLAVHVIRPRLGTPGRATDPSFVTWSSSSYDQVTESLTGDPRVTQITRIQILSRIAMRKMKSLRLASDFALVAMVATAAALIAH